jgi:hypothetical protein
LKRIKSLMVNLHKSKTNDQNEKGVEIQGWHWSSAWVKVDKIKTLGSIRGAIERH